MDSASAENKNKATAVAVTPNFQALWVGTVCLAHLKGDENHLTADD